MKNLIFSTALCAALGLSPYLHAQIQVECLTPGGVATPETTSPSNPMGSVPPCNPDYMSYLPSPTTPVKYVKVNLHVVDTLGKGKNFSGTPAELTYLEKAFKFADTIFRYVLPPVIPSGGGITDSRVGIMFDVNHDVYYHEDENLCHFGFSNIDDCVEKFGVLPHQELNLFLQHDFSSKTGGYANQLPFFPAGTSGNDWFLACAFKNIYADFAAGNSYKVFGYYLAHEIGHAIGLKHTHSTTGVCCGSGDDFTDTPPEHGGINPPTYIPGSLGTPCIDATVQGGCANHSNNIMSYNWSGGADPSVAGRHLSVMQVAYINANLTIHPQVHHFARMASSFTAKQIAL